MDNLPAYLALLEGGMATHCSILAWRIPMDRGALRGPRGHKEPDTTERLSTSCPGKVGLRLAGRRRFKGPSLGSQEEESIKDAKKTPAELFSIDFPLEGARKNWKVRAAGKGMEVLCSSASISQHPVADPGMGETG